MCPHRSIADPTGDTSLAELEMSRKCIVKQSAARVSLLAVSLNGRFTCHTGRDVCHNSLVNPPHIPIISS